MFTNQPALSARFLPGYHAIERLEEHERYHAAFIFGSVARGEETEVATCWMDSSLFITASFSPIAIQAYNLECALGQAIKGAYEKWPIMRSHHVGCLSREAAHLSFRLCNWITHNQS